MSASKTINLPSTYSFEETKGVYKWCWENGIKGCTIFRPNELRQGIFITEEIEKEESKNTLLNIPWGTTLDASDDLIGKKHKLMTGCGSLHLQAWFDISNGKLMEIFLSKGSTGGCNSFMVGLSRTISLALRTGASFDYAIDQLKSVPSCPSFVTRTAIKKDTSVGTSCPSAIANTLIKMQKEVFNDLGIEEDEKITISIKTVNKEKQSLFTQQELDFLNKNGEIAFAIHFGKCPKCGEKLEHAEGCLSCSNCGFTKC
jgi:ribonucleoside-diphosphate reductase alpha chain